VIASVQIHSQYANSNFETAKVQVYKVIDWHTHIYKESRIWHIMPPAPHPPSTVFGNHTDSQTLTAVFEIKEEFLKKNQIHGAVNLKNEIVYVLNNAHFR